MHHLLQLLALAAALAVGLLLSPAEALNFHQPGIKGKALDYCLTLSSKEDGCGAPAADAWCKALGYDRARGFTGPTRAAPGKKTLAIQSQEVCDSSGGKGCSTFVAINCIREKLFNDPKVDGKLLDWCMEGNKECGRPVADAFCESQGFSRGAWSYGGPSMAISQDTDGTVRILNDGSRLRPGSTCNIKTEKCQALSSIFCEK